VRIAGTGCCLMDIIYPSVDFSSEAFALLRSRSEGDGGLEPGRLVFAEDAERFASRSGELGLAGVLAELAPGGPAAENVGGPSVVSLVHAAQILEGEGATVSYHGAVGDDESGRRLRDLLGRTSLDAARLETRRGRTPSTYVLSDPSWDGGRGERCFVNEIGAAELYAPADLGEDFLGADLVAFGGTALVPAVHEGLPSLLAAARGRGALTVVNTVFDFRSERLHPGRPWALGGIGPGPGPAAAYAACDLIIMDRDEALRLSGESGLEAAARFLASSGAGAFAITRGGEDVIAWAGGGRFSPFGPAELPVAPVEAAARAGGDTTGCGDAFAGGVIAALALQMKAGARAGLDLADAISWGVSAGAFALGILGGVYFERRAGDERRAVEALRAARASGASRPRPLSPGA
jgi:sugar/nucleoside kinase (ribokinase family)